MLKTAVLSVFIISALSIAAIPNNEEGFCYGIALQGGGDRGSYEAGVLYGFVTYGNPTDFEYDVVTGVSAGSINTMAIIIYPKGREVDMVEFIKTSWLACSQDDIFHQWPLGYAQGLLKPSLVDNDPELNYLKSQIYAAPNQRYAVVVTTDVNTASKVTFNEEDWTTDADFAANTALFSSAIPAFFKYRVYPPFTFIDGGWSEGIDMEDAILRCRQQGFPDQQIVMDVIYCANTTINMKQAESLNGMNMYFRGQAISDWRKNTYLFSFTKQSFPNVEWRYFAIPTHVLPNENFPVDFTQANMEYMIDLGITDAQALLAEGPGVSMDRVDRMFKAYQRGLSMNSRIPYVVE